MVSPGRLAEIIERMSAERRPDRLAPSVLAAALAATGARGGRLVGQLVSGRLGVLAVEGDETAEASVIAAELQGPDGSLGHIEVWGVPDEDAAEAALRLVAAVCARSFETIGIERERADERTRARRLGAAATAVHEPRDPREAVARVLAEARALVDAPAAALLAAGAPTPEVAAYDGLDALSPRDLASLVPPDRRAELAAGHAWRGTLPDHSTLRDRGFASAALVGIGPRAALGVLAVFGDSDVPVSQHDLDALGELAGHVATALTMSILRQEVRELGTVDPTTRFFNARYFQSRLDQECQRALRAGVPLSVAIMSLDGLAEMRERGEGAAEAAVEALAAHVAERLRGMDVGCRVGDNELAAILPEVEGLDALRVGERIRATVGDAPALDDAFRLSVGIASFPSQAGRPESLVENAHSALEWARTHGGDRTFLFHAETAEILRAEERERVGRRRGGAHHRPRPGGDHRRAPPQHHPPFRERRARGGPDRGRARPRPGGRGERACGRAAARRGQDRRQRRRHRTRRPAERRPARGAAPPSGDRRAHALGQPPGLGRPLGAAPPRARGRHWGTRPACAARRSRSRAGCWRWRTPSTT